MRISSSGVGQFLYLDSVFFKFLLGQGVWFHSSWNILKQAQVRFLKSIHLLTLYCTIFIVIRLGIIYLQDILIWTERFYRGSVPNRAKKPDFVHYPLTNVYFGKTISLEHFQTCFSFLFNKMFNKAYILC